MLTFAIVAVVAVALIIAYEISRESNQKEYAKAYMQEEQDMQNNPARGKVLQGVFRKHNEQFRRDGIPGPKGTA